MVTTPTVLQSFHLCKSNSFFLLTFRPQFAFLFLQLLLLYDYITTAGHTFGEVQQLLVIIQLNSEFCGVEPHRNSPNVVNTGSKNNSVNKNGLLLSEMSHPNSVTLPNKQLTAKLRPGESFLKLNVTAVGVAPLQTPSCAAASLR